MNSYRVAETRIDGRLRPIGIDHMSPLMSWKIVASERSINQVAFEIRVGTSISALSGGGALIWQSPRIASSTSAGIPYGGPELRSRAIYYWQVRVWCAGHDEPSPWSEIDTWEMGLLRAGDWRADWIQARPRQSGEGLPLLRKEFSARGQIRNARVYATALGLYQLNVNGQRATDQRLTPGWTSWSHRLQYQIYDVTSLLKGKDRNAIAVLLARGWREGPLRRVHPQEDPEPSLLLQLHLEYEDGGAETIKTDESWLCHSGPLMASSIFDGEIWDGRQIPRGWDQPDFDTRSWAECRMAKASSARLVAQAAPPIRETERIVPPGIRPFGDGRTIVDFGQNLAGWVRLKAQGPRGSRVTLRHAEVLRPDGALYMDNLKSAKQRMEFVLGGDGEETLEPHFSFQGFRYVEIVDPEQCVVSESIEAIVVHSDLERTGDFRCSDPQLNKLHENILWSQRSNFVGVPTDCPQRDERLGWAADAMLFLPTAAFNMNVSAFFASWLEDMRAEQAPSGAIHWTVPAFAKGTAWPEEAGAGWGDAATMVPFDLYRIYGNAAELARNYEMMKGWANYEYSRIDEEGLWSGDLQLGDWLDFFSQQVEAREDASIPEFVATCRGHTSAALIATVFLYRSTIIVAEAARILHRRSDEQMYRDRAKRVQAAFIRAFVRGGGVIGEGTQTAYVLPLAFDILPAKAARRAAALLAADVRKRGHLTTGFLGTPFLLEALSRYGFEQEAFRLLLRTSFPSWLYPLSKGATTIWERWDGIRPDGSLQNPFMNSFNHYAYGSVGTWMYNHIGGLRQDTGSVGFQRFTLRPPITDKISSSRLHYESAYGLIRANWVRSARSFHFEVSIPPNSSASIHLPLAYLEGVRESGRPLEDAAGLSLMGGKDDYLLVSADSGEYDFSYDLPAASLNHRK